MAAHSWEAPPQLDWDKEEHDNPFCDEDAAFSYDTVSQEDAGEQLADLLIQLKQLGKLSAKQACVLSFWAAKAGACGFVSQLAYRPDDPATGHYSRHWDRVTGTSPDDKVVRAMHAGSSAFRRKSCGGRYLSDPASRGTG